MDWSPLLNDCDFVHMRMLLGSLQTEAWPHVYRKIFEYAQDLTSNDSPLTLQLGN